MKVKWCVICSSHYEKKDIMALEGAYNSVKKLQETLLFQLYIPEEDVIFLYDKNLLEISNKIIDFQESLLEDDTVIFYFCGHGIKIKDELWLFTSNSRWQNVELSSLNYKNVIQSFRRTKVKRIIAILDCCNSGAAIKLGMERPTITRNEVTCEGEVILCSCSEIETAIEKEIGEELHSIFTYVFTDVLSQGCSYDKKYLSIHDIMLVLKEKYEAESGRTLIIDKKQNLDDFPLIKNMNYKKQSLGEIERIFVKKKPMRKS